MEISEIQKRFLTNTDETGRFIVKSLITGRTYYGYWYGSSISS